MLLLIFTLFVLFLYRIGHFREIDRHQEMRRLDQHIMQAYDDAMWDDDMADFRSNNQHRINRPYMSFGGRR